MIGLGNEIAGKEEALAGARRPIGQLKPDTAARCAGPSGRAVALDKALAELVSENATLRHVRAERNAHVASSEHLLIALRAPTSWRVTARLRGASGLTRRLRYSAFSIPSRSGCERA